MLTSTSYSNVYVKNLVHKGISIEKERTFYKVNVQINKVARVIRNIPDLQMALEVAIDFYIDLTYKVPENELLNKVVELNKLFNHELAVYPV